MRKSRLSRRLSLCPSKAGYKFFPKLTKSQKAFFEKDRSDVLNNDHKIKKRYIRNKIVYDPNIDPDIMGDDPEAKKQYKEGKSKRKVYHGV